MQRDLTSVAQAQRIAQKRLPAPIYRTLVGGMEMGLTRDQNVQAFGEIDLIPRVANLGDIHDQKTRVLGQEISFPVITSCAGAPAIHPDGELAVARATKAAGTAIALSNFASRPLEQITAANSATFFQMYWYGTRQEIQRRIDRAKRAGAQGLIVTLDWAYTYRNDWDTAITPGRGMLGTIMQFALPAMSRPSWLFGFLSRGRLPDFKAPNAAGEGQPALPFNSVFPLIMSTPQPTWDDIAWLRAAWGGPFLIKGIMHPDDARMAVQIGATAISVSNHGGNNIDTTPASIRVLPAIAEAVGNEIEVIFDGGIRRGSDVVKALALGARAVLIGRAHLFALAAGGERGVFQILELLRSGIQETLLALGRASIGDLTPSDVLLPEGFAILDFPQRASNN